MAQIQKYAFDTEFAPDGAILRETRTRLGPEQVEVERKAAYEKGKQDATAQAERQAAAALEALAKAANAALGRLEDESAAMREEAARIALAAARKIAGAALEAYGAERVAAAIEAAMDGLRHQPRLVVKISADAIEALRPRVEAMAQAHAYAGAVLVRGDPAFAAGEVSIDWSDGVMNLKPEEAVQRIEALIEAALAAPAAAE